MSGTLSAAFEQSQLVDVAEAESSPQFSQEAPDSVEADPIASFLEKHGSTLMQNHEGQMVTVAEAIANCPPFARLVEAMGEGVLSLAATQRPEENEEETEEAETEEATAQNEDRTEAKEEAKKSEKNTNRVQQEKTLASKQEVQKVEQSQAAEPQKQKLMASSETTTIPQAAVSTETTGSNTAQLSAVGIAPPKEAAQTISQESQPAESPAALETPTTNDATSYFVESPAPEPGRTVLAELPAAPLAALETDGQSILAKEVPEPAKVSVPAATETEELGEWLDEIPQIDELYQTSDLETQTNHAEIEVEDIIADSEITFQLPTDEQWQSLAESVEQELAEGQTSEGFILPIPEASAFGMAEYAQDSPETATELSVPVEEVEQTILLVADSIEKMEAEEAEIAHQILDEIVHKIAEAQTLYVERDSENPEVVLETADLEEELKELFIQLFDQVEIEYSPELVESCVKLALQGDISDLIAKIEQEDEEVDVSHDEGTHEVIKKLLATISSIKKSVLRAYQIGKSVLQLYLQQLVLAQ